jgi:hypothetical protein
MHGPASENSSREKAAESLPEMPDRVHVGHSAIRYNW